MAHAYASQASQGSPMTIKVYLDLALQGKKGPSAKDLRMMAFMENLYGE